jgi:hypothetical protein
MNTIIADIEVMVSSGEIINKSRAIQLQRMNTIIADHRGNGEFKGDNYRDNGGVSGETIIKCRTHQLKE